MAGQGPTPVQMVEALLPVLLEVLASFNAYNRLSPKKGNRRKAFDFRIRFENYLKTLQLALRAPSQHPRTREAIVAIHELLYILDERLIVCDSEGEQASDQSDEETDDKGDELRPGKYTSIENLLDQERHVPRNTDKRVEWLRKRILVENVSRQTRNDLPIRVEGLCRALGTTRAEAAQDDIELTEGQKNIEEWPRAKQLFQRFEQISESLQSHWAERCTCLQYEHESTKVSPCVDQLQSQDRGTCWLMVTSPSHVGQVWNARKVSFARARSRVRVATLEEGAQVPAAVILDSDKRSAEACLCIALHSTDENIMLDDHKDHLCVETSKNPGTDPARLLLRESGLITRCLDHSSLTERARLLLALRLVYAYMYLSGSLLWPYDSMNVWLVTDGLSSIVHPFFCLHQGPSGEREMSDRCEDTNRHMPSLPALGKLILELVTGDTVSWNSVDSEVDCLSKEETVFSRSYHQAVRSCFDSSLKDGTIRDHEHLRLQFFNKIVSPLQYIVQVGFYASVEQVLGLPIGGSDDSMKKTRRKVEFDAPTKAKVSERHGGAAAPKSHSSRLDTWDEGPKQLFTENMARDFSRVQNGNVYLKNEGLALERTFVICADEVRRDL